MKDKAIRTVTGIGWVGGEEGYNFSKYPAGGRILIVIQLHLILHSFLIEF